MVSNTSSETKTATLSVDGTSPHQSAPLQISLAPWETRVLDILRDIAGRQNGHIHTEGGISITHTGAPGAVVARIFIAKPNKGYSAAVNFIDPEATASQRWHGSGLRFRNLNGAQLSPVIAVRNTGGEPSRVNGKIIYTEPDGSVGTINLPQRTIDPGTTRVFNLQSFINGLPASVTYGGIEVEYDTPKGSMITSVQSGSANGEHVFEVPMFDPEKMPSSAGGFPWKADGDFRTVVYIKNETDVARKYTAHLVYEGGQYSLGVNDIKPSQTIAVDFRDLRDSQTPDSMGRVIPLGLTTGQIAWSVKGADNKTLSGRSEQISTSGGVASTYACYNCCPDSVYQTSILPSYIQLAFGATEYLEGQQTDMSCNGTPFGPYVPTGIFWNSDNVNVATVDGGQLIGVGPGTVTISAIWVACLWWYDGQGYCEEVCDQILEYAFIEVTNPLPTIPDIATVEKNGLGTVNVSITGAGTNDSTIFRLRRTSGTGSATFEDGTTEKSYSGNLASTELKIKGVTESSSANNYVMEAVVNGTTHQPSAKTFTVAVITSLVFERINTTGGSPDVPFDNNPGTDGTHTAGEGLRIFPDENTHNDQTDRSAIRVKATVTPASVPNLNVYFASFDLDDPSANSAPIDTNGSNGNDNNGHVNNSRSGEFSAATGVSCMNASTGTSPLHISKITCPVSGTETSAHFRVTMQPGDNFTVAASLDLSFRDEFRVNASDGYNLVNSTGQVIPISGESNPNNIRGIRATMLTVWRRLHIELDSMGKARENFYRGNVSGAFTINGGQTVSMNVGNAGLETNRFENGRLELAFISSVFDVISNTPSSVTIKNSSSSPITYANNANFQISNFSGNRTAIGYLATGQTVAPGQTITAATTGTPFDDNSFANGALYLTPNLQSLRVLGNTGTSATVQNLGSGQIAVQDLTNFRLYDDDDMDDNDASLLNGDEGDDVPIPDTSLLADGDNPATNVLAPAFIRPKYDLAGSPGEFPFFANIGSAQQQVDLLLTARFSNISSESNAEFWTIYLLGAYQFDFHNDGDPKFTNGMINAAYGVANAGAGLNNGTGAALFTEVGRPFEYPSNPNSSISRAHTVAHEVGHLLSGIHGNGGLMQITPFRTSGVFSESSILQFRTVAHP
ncbi:MAG: hypothetical protein IPM25_16645 [Chloracidobacterium sp.]|nr:hypothetical protein [Chloracidobacterium sp.]